MTVSFEILLARGHSSHQPCLCTATSCLAVLSPTADTASYAPEPRPALVLIGLKVTLFTSWTIPIVPAPAE